MKFSNSVYKIQTTIIAIFISFFISSTGWATTYYVDSRNGKNSNAGTPSAPWETIQKAADTMVAGDTAIVRAASSSERVRITRSGASGIPITFQAQGWVVMRGFTILASYIRVGGFEIKNTIGGSWTESSGIYIKGINNEALYNFIHDVAHYGIFLDASPASPSSTSNNTVRNNRIAWAVDAGIRVMGANNLIQANDISHSRQYQPGVTTYQPGGDADGIRFFGSGHTIRKNYIHDIYSSDPGNSYSPHIDAIQTWGPAYNIIFEQNTFHIPDNSMQGAMISSVSTPVKDLTFRNNIFINGSTGYGPGLNIMGYNGYIISNITIVNNNFIRTNGPATYCVWLHDGIQTAKVKNNAFYDCGNQSTSYFSTAPYSGGTTSGIDVGYNSISKSDGRAPVESRYPNDLWLVDPKFVNFAAKDFHLQSTSPLINAGAPLIGATNDYDGVSRPQGAGHDIGAYELKSQ